MGRSAMERGKVDGKWMKSFFFDRFWLPGSREGHLSLQGVSRAMDHLASSEPAGGFIIAHGIGPSGITKDCLRRLGRWMLKTDLQRDWLDVFWRFGFRRLGPKMRTSGLSVVNARQPIRHTPGKRTG